MLLNRLRRDDDDGDGADDADDNDGPHDNVPRESVAMATALSPSDNSGNRTMHSTDIIVVTLERPISPAHLRFYFV